MKLKRDRTIPLEEGFTLGPKELQHAPDQDERNKYRKLGYLRLLGNINWAIRQCHMELGFHCSILASVMAAPTRQVLWHGMLHLQSYIGYIIHSSSDKLYGTTAFC